LTAFLDEDLGAKLAQTGLVVRLTLTEPDSVLIVDMAQRRVHCGENPELQPAETLTMTAGTANAYWQGRVNLPFAMARGTVTVEGSIANVLRLSPLTKKLYPVYVNTLKSAGRHDLLV